MIAYIDSSVLLRIAFGQDHALPEWPSIQRGVSSALILTESLRTLDRARLRGGLSDLEIARRRSTVLALIGTLELVEVDAVILERASQSMPTQIGTLDAIHLVSAVLWRETTGIAPAMATHDVALGLAAQAHGLTVLGT